jgi:hypothetical protein
MIKRNSVAGWLEPDLVVIYKTVKGILFNLFATDIIAYEA